MLTAEMSRAQVCGCVLPAQDLQQLSDPIVMFCLIYKPIEQHRVTLGMLYVM